LYNNDIGQLDTHLSAGIILSGNLSEDPLLSDDFLLPVNSACVDAGSAEALSLPATDFEGSARSVDGDCDAISMPDMGADEYLDLPTVITAVVTPTSTTAAMCGGTVIDSGGHAVTARGVCWSIGNSPTTADPNTNNGEGAGPFESQLTGLVPGATYYVRAYATSCEGTAYGEARTAYTGPVRVVGPLKLLLLDD
jgi:hypothetical protein